MKRKILSIVLSLVFIFVLSLSILPINCFAQGETYINFENKTYNPGDEINVTVSVKGEAISVVTLEVTYNPEVLEYVSGGTGGGAGVAKIYVTHSVAEPVTLSSHKLVFKALKAGSSNIKVSGGMSDGVPPNLKDVTIAGASASLSVVDATLSSNANLRALSLINIKLTPSFSPDRTTYDVAVANSVTECRVSARAADANAKVEVTGTPKLQIGLNTRTVVVTAPDGTQKTYTINITRSETADEPTSSDEPTVSEDPFAATVEGAPYTIISDISTIQLFKGFTVKEKEFKGTTVTVAVDEAENYEIFYLKADGSEEFVPFTYDEETETFTKLAYITQGEFTYILADLPSELAVPENYYRSNTRINGFDVCCYSDSDSALSDFYYIYCYNDGKYSFYRYDSAENVLQRFPELKAFKQTDAPIDDEEIGFFDRFSSLTVNAKVIVISVTLLLVAAIVLIVLVVMKLFKRDNNIEDEIETFDFDSEPFESVSLNNFSFASETEDLDEDYDESEETDDLIGLEDDEQEEE
ncbi:MAG: hypothetical protein E7560_01145 [Ruminococcaceae bacterium]|nr:hypothetical protein [Oscillospiraceae bacterium]